MRGRFRFGFVIERMIGVLILGLEMELSQHFLKLVVDPAPLDNALENR